VNEDEKLAKLFFEAFERTSFALTIRNGVPVRNWEDLTDSMRKILIATCADVLRNWNPS
jgi:hypothetical protein